MQDKQKLIQGNLERNIYNFYMALAGNSGGGTSFNGSIKWVKTYPSCWPNYIFDADFKQNNIRDELLLLVEQIRTGNAPNSWFIGPGADSALLRENLKKYGFKKAFDWPGMAIDLEQMNSSFTVSGDFIINEVDDTDNLKNWSDVINSGMFGYGFEGVNLFKDLLAREDIKLFLGFFAGLPVSTSLLFLNSGIASLFLIATLPDFRMRGFGTQLTLAPLNKARECGYEHAGLFATSSGERIYKKIGFEKICDFDIYYL